MAIVFTIAWFLSGMLGYWILSELDTGAPLWLIPCGPAYLFAALVASVMIAIDAMQNKEKP